MTILDEVEASIRQQAEGAGSSVVGIEQRWGVGSGIVLAEGRVLTNAHDVRGDQVTVTFADGRPRASRSAASTTCSMHSGGARRRPRTRVVRGTDERTVQVFTPEIEGK
jgi:hypothetical protein